MGIENKAQGATEYILIFAIIIILALIAIGIFAWFPGITSGITGVQSQAYWQSTTPFAITTYEISSEGEEFSTLVLRNNTTNKLTLQKVMIGGIEVFDENLSITGGSEKVVTLSEVPECEHTETYAYEIEMRYARSVSGSTVHLRQIGEKPLVGKCT